MKSRERILNTLLGKKTDRKAFSPFLAYWWEAQSEEFTQEGELEFLESIGADPLFRGHYPMHGKNYEDMVLFKKEIRDCEIKTEIFENTKHVYYHTSIGDLKFGYRYVSSSNTWFLVDHPVKMESDFNILRHIMENTSLTPDYKRFEEEATKLGERGLLLPIICPELKSSFQSLLEHWVGTEGLVYALMDYPETVNATLKEMNRVSMTAANIAAASSSPVFLSWEDTSTTNISPNYYQKYILPEINNWCDILHRSNKLYIQHACGHLNDLLTDIANSNIDAIESITSAPTGNVKLQELCDILPPHITIIGGIEPVGFLNCSERELNENAELLLECMKERRYILANSDSCPPGVTIEKFMILAKTTAS